MKIFKFLLVSILFINLICVPVFAVTICINGDNEVVNEIIENGNTLVPLRGVFEKLGYSVGYDKATETAFIKSTDTNIIIRNGKYTFTVNEKTIYPSTAQRIVDGTFYIPLRSVAESIGAEVLWKNNCIYINTEKKPEKEFEKVYEKPVFENYSGIKSDYYVCDNMQMYSNRSYVYKSENGYFFVTSEYENVNITELDEDLHIINTTDIPCELPYFGGYFYDGNCHYIVTGNESTDYYSDNIVYEIRQYDKTFTLANTTKLSAKSTGVEMPFVDGSVEFVTDDNFIYIIDTCKRFAPKYSDKIQGNYMICVSRKNISVFSKGIVNEIKNDTGQLYKGFKAYACSAKDNSLVLCYTDTSSSPSVAVRKMSLTSLYSVNGTKIHTVYDNLKEGTFNVCGFEKLGNSYIAAGTSFPQYDKRNNTNVFISVINEKFFMPSAAKTKWLTNFSYESGNYAKNAKCVKIDNNNMLVLWEETISGETRLKGVVIDENGNTVKEISADKYMKLSNCDLYNDNGSVIWFCSDSSEEKTYIYKIDLQ